MDGRSAADSGGDTGNGGSDRVRSDRPVDTEESSPLAQSTIDGPSSTRPTDAETVECTVRLSDDLAGDLDDFCRKRYLHRDDAVRSLLAEWLDSQSAE